MKTEQEIKIEQLEVKLKKLKINVSNYALAFSLLQEVADGSMNDENWIDTRFIPGLKILKIKPRFSNGEA